MEKRFESDGKCEVSMVGFDSLSEIEIDAVKRVMPTYLQKLENMAKNASLKVRLRTRQHNKMFVHELEADFFVPGMKNFSTNVSDKNLYKALAATMSKLVSEVGRSVRRK